MAHSAWIDRLSVQSTPSTTPPPQSRSYSPGPRRWSQFGSPSLNSRPTINARSSSLSLASNTSSTSLPGGVRVVNSSGLRNQLANSSADDAEDPMVVLERIIGRKLPSKTIAAEHEPIGLPHQAATEITEIEFDGMSLQSFAEGPRSRQPLAANRLNTYSVEQYAEEKEKFEDLHRSILACDEVLKSVETSLASFQADLGAVSAEIESLQARSVTLNTKLQNRKVVEQHLGPVVEGLGISPATIRKISEESIDETWVRALRELEERSEMVKSKDDKQTKAVADLQPLMENLQNKAVERIRDYLVSQIKGIRAPGVNAQVIQRQAFIKNKDLYAFLVRRGSSVVEGILQAYINTMRWYYSHNFHRYETALKRLKIHLVDKQDMLGSDDLRPGQKSSKVAAPSRDHLSLGRRDDILKHPSSTPPSASLVEDDKSIHFLEIPFRAFGRVLVDNACWEYGVLMGFLSHAHRPYHSLVSRTFSQIFEPTFEIGRAFTRSLIDVNYDAIGVLICIRLTQHFAFSLQRLRVPVVDGYVNSISMLLWPRFQQLIDAHCESVRQTTSQLPSRPAASSILTSSSSSASQSAAPHPLTQRFARFSASVVSLSAEASDDEPISRSLGRLRADFEACLTKLSRGIGDVRRRERFLDNNYALVIAVLDGIQGKLAEELRSRFQELRSATEG